MHNKQGRTLRNEGPSFRGFAELKNLAKTICLAAIMASLVPATGFAVMLVLDEFEWALDNPDPSRLASRNWLAYGNVFDPFGGYLYGYSPGYGFCRFAIGEGGPEQGMVQLVVSSDYGNVDHADSNFIEMNLYQEWTLGPENMGHTYQFKFDAKRGNLEGVSTAAAFIKTLDPNSGYALTNFITRDMTSVSETWETYWLQITVDNSLLGQILQMGFMNTATKYQGAAVFYDNTEFGNEVSGVPSRSAALEVTLAQNYPNPFNPKTKIDFELSNQSVVSLRIYDLSGRLVRTLLDGEVVDAGRREAVWRGMDERGRQVAAGVYFYRLEASAFGETKRMTLVK